jgi:hypothetical protein
MLDADGRATAGDLTQALGEDYKEPPMTDGERQFLPLTYSILLCAGTPGS